MPNCEWTSLRAASHSGVFCVRQTQYGLSLGAVPFAILAGALVLDKLGGHAVGGDFGVVGVDVILAADAEELATALGYHRTLTEGLARMDGRDEGQERARYHIAGLWIDFESRNVLEASGTDHVASGVCTAGNTGVGGRWSGSGCVWKRSS